VDVVAINNDVLTEILVSIETMFMWYGWLVDGPVVEWWVDNWIASLGEVHFFSFLFNMDLIWTDSHVHAEISITHGVLHEGWVHMHWYTSLVLLSQDLVRSHLGGLLLWKSNLIWTDENLHVKVGITHGILGNYWVDEYGDSLSERLFVCDQILHFVFFLDLGEFHCDGCWLICHKILQGSEGHILTEEG